MLYLFNEYKWLGKCVKSFKENKFYEKEKLMSRNRSAEIVQRPWTFVDYCDHGVYH